MASVCLSVCLLSTFPLLSPFAFLFPFFSLRDLHAIVFYLSPAFAPVSPLLGLCASLLFSIVFSLYVCVSPTSWFTVRHSVIIIMIVLCLPVCTLLLYPHLMNNVTSLLYFNTLETINLSIIASAAQLSMIFKSDLKIEKERIMFCGYGFVYMLFL